MLVYNILAISSIALKPLLKNKKLYLITLAILMIIISGFRGIHVGTDTVNYFPFYEEIKTQDLYESFDFTERIEFGVVCIAHLAYFLYDSTWMFTFLMSFFTIIAFTIFVYNIFDEEDYHMAVFVFLTYGFFAYMLNAERQALAIAICSNSLCYIFHHSYLKATLIVIFASLFHTSLLVFLPAIICLKLFDRKMNKFKRIIILILSSILLLLLFYFLFNYVANNLEILQGKFLHYFSVESSYNAARDAGKRLVMMMMMCIGIAVSLILGPCKVKMEWPNFTVSLLLIIATIFMIAQTEVMFIFFRLVDTFLFYLVLGIPFFFRQFSQSSYKIIMMALFCIGSIAYMNYIGITGFNGVYPYEFDFDV